MCMQTKCSRKDVAPEKDVGNNPPPPAPDSIIPPSFTLCPQKLFKFCNLSRLYYVSVTRKCHTIC